MDPFSQLLAGKVAIVTGVTSGLGEGCARVFAARGARVVGTGRRAERGRTLEAQIPNFRFVTADVARREDCERTVVEAVSAFGQVDILINNAGTTGEIIVNPVHELDEQEWDRIVDANLKGALFMARYALPHMRARKDGVIINIASINARIAVANMAAYNASKAGLIQASHTMAVENLDRNIRVMAIILGGVGSETGDVTSLAFGRHILGDPNWRPQKPPSQHGLDRIWQPEHVARTLSMLCHEDSQTITGSTIAIDMGASCGAWASAMIYMGAAGLLPGG
ncbi:MAG: SDR family NAD(P)-dependent oxidoreductase [Gammaproteobacteria bacterium]